MKKKLSMLLAGAMLFGTLMGCGEGGDDAASTPPATSTDPGVSEPAQSDNEPYKIALIAPLTGASAERGTSYRSAIEYKLAEVNAAGGVNGHLIECDFYDDKGDSKESVTVASLVAEKDEYLACFGPFSSACAIADAPTFEDTGLVLFAPSSSPTC